jgi:hypothetical protein
VKVKDHANVIVLSMMGVGLTTLAFYLPIKQWGLLIGICAGLIITSIIIYEAWAITNEYPGDTLSEALWRLSSRPIVPWLFGGASEWLILSHTLTDPHLIAAWFFLQGHFFFQAQKEKEKLDMKDQVDVAKTGILKISGEALQLVPVD